jgi:hypothetical protein
MFPPASESQILFISIDQVWSLSNYFLIRSNPQLRIRANQRRKNLTSPVPAGSRVPFFSRPKRKEPKKWPEVGCRQTAASWFRWLGEL